MYVKYMMSVSHDVLDLSSCKTELAVQYHVPEIPILPFPQIISLGQKYTHHVVDVHYVRSLQ